MCEPFFMRRYLLYLIQVVSIGEPVEEGRPKLAAWLARVQTEMEPEWSQSHASLLKFGRKHQADSKAGKL